MKKLIIIFVCFFLFFLLWKMTFNPAPVKEKPTFTDEELREHQLRRIRMLDTNEHQFPDQLK